jgi:hypothetical protein
MDTNDSTRGQSSSTIFWAQVREAGRHKWKYCPTLHLQLLIWLPLWIFWDQLGCIDNHFSETSKQCLWERPGEMQFTSSQCWLKAVLERPTSTIALSTYLMLFLVTFTSLIAYRNRPSQLKDIAFWLHCLTALAIRCLTSYSGHTTIPSWIWSPSSPSKGLWI